ncbi:MAG: hypothetical protein ACMG57_03750 [Candidatus Dojkabacteria bacterium]
MDIVTGDVRMPNESNIKFPTSRFDRLLYWSIRGQAATDENEKTRNLLLLRGFNFSELEIYRFIVEVPSYPSLHEMYSFYSNFMKWILENPDYYPMLEQLLRSILGTKFTNESGEINLEDLEQAIVLIEAERMMSAFAKISHF